MTTSPALANAVQYARKRTQTITWTDEDGVPVNLTSATLLGIIDRGGVESLITGTLTVTGASTGTFTWAYSAADVAEAGTFFVQFYARYSGGSELPEISYRHRWHVAPAFAFPFVSPSTSPSASVSPSASASASA